VVEIWLPYGSSEIPVRVPEERLVEILTPHKLRGADAPAELKRLVESNNSLLDTAKTARKICIAVGASSNSGLTTDVVKTLVDTLTSVGVPRTSVTLVRTTDAPQLDLNTLGEVTIIAHNPASADAAPLQGFNGDLVPAVIAAFADSDLKILVGELKPHHFLGRSGLCDIVFPGLASRDSVRNHLADRKGITAMDLHRERLEITSSIKNLFAVGFVLDSDRSPSKITLGGIDSCMKDLEQPLQTTCANTVNQTADIVVMSVGGKPTDESLLRAVDAFPAALPSLKRDGVIIVAAECPLGHGDTEFYDWCAERKEARYLEARLRHSFNYNGFKAAFLLRTLESHRIYLVSTIPDHYVEGIFGMKAAPTVNSALQTAQRTIGSDSTISVIPDASSITTAQAPSHSQG
jgi:nickel-dependent lactate racemase